MMSGSSPALQPQAAWRPVVIPSDEVEDELPGYALTANDNGIQARNFPRNQVRPIGGIDDNKTENGALKFNGSGSLPDKIKAKLSSFDVDGDGKVSAEELSEVVEQLMRDEAESGRINVTRFSSHIKSKLIQFDENSDGTIDAKDLEGVITGLVAEEASVKRFRTLAMFSVFLMFFILCANAGMAVAVAYLSKDSKVDSDKMVSKTTGNVLQVASSDFFLNENGELISRKAQELNGNVTVADAYGRRLLQEGGEPISGAVVTAPMTNSKGVLSTGTGAPVKIEKATYETNQDDFGVEDLFNVPRDKVKTITNWEVAEEVGGSTIDLPIFGAEHASKTILPDEYFSDVTPAEGEEGDGEQQILRVQQIRMLSSHYKYSMIVLYKFELLSSDFDTTLDVTHIGPVLVEKGEEASATIDNVLLLMKEKEEGAVALGTRHLLSRMRDMLNSAKQALRSVVSLVVNSAKALVGYMANQITTALQLVMDLPGMLRDIPGTVMKYIRELASSFLPGVQMVSDQLLELIRAYVPYEGMCMPLEDLTSKMDSNSKARQLLAKEAVTIWSDDDTGKVDAEMTQLDQCAKLNLETDMEKVETFLYDVLDVVVKPIVTKITDGINDVFGPIITPIIEILEKVAGVVRVVEQKVQEVNAAIQKINFKRRLMRRRLMGEDVNLDGPPTRKEMEELFDDLVAHAVGVASERKGMEIREDTGTLGMRAQRRRLITGAEYFQDGWLGEIHVLVQQMFDVTHGAIVSELHTEMERHKVQQGLPMAQDNKSDRKLLEGDKLIEWNQIKWENLIAFKALNLAVTLDFTQTFRTVIRKTSPAVISGDLLEMTGVTEDVQLPYKVVGMDKEVYAGFKISLELLLDLKMPITLMTEGMADVLVTVSLQGMELKIDALNGGKVHFEGGDASASGVVLNGHTRVGGKVDIQFGVTAMIKACVMGPCATLTAGGSASVQAGFDAIYGYAEDPAVRGSYLDASSDNYLGESLMVPEMKYDIAEFSCVDDDTPTFSAGGVFFNIPKPYFGIAFEPPLAKSLPIPDLPMIYEYKQTGSIYSKPLMHFCIDDPPAPDLESLDTLLQTGVQSMANLLDTKLGEQGLSLQDLNSFDANDVQREDSITFKP